MTEDASTRSKLVARALGELTPAMVVAFLLSL